MAGWIREIRSKIGSDLIFVNSAGGWIEDHEGKVLLQKRSAVHDHWGFPGGIVELGESAADAAVREIFEETGLIVSPIELLGVYSKYFVTCENGDQCQTFTVFFKMKIIGGELLVDNKETFELSFFSPTSLPPLIYEQHQHLVSDVAAGRIPAFR
ncbi:NUDIX hydrolase [Microvirga sp. Mcv34]|uniref:NUDIX hydrolase n=1 Tax=Microvirga sp. Mcv34 TaxID=2926016 RepID=UPI0021C85158|nr:NUDIX domain-containing protein [Microvirga sp. Mcv34]